MSSHLTRRRFLAVAGAAALTMAGCHKEWTNYYKKPGVQPLGTIHDSVMMNQEVNAEHSDFIVYEHEFAPNAEFLNTDGEDHVKRIAARLAGGQESQILVERTRNSARPETEFKYRVHPNPQLDMRRRDIIVRSLQAMGIPDADSRVVVAPSPATKFRSGELPFDLQGGGQGFGGFFFGGGY